MDMTSIAKNEKVCVYLIVNERGETLNVYGTIGMAIDAIGYQACRIDKGCIKSRTLTKIEWTGRDGNDYSEEIFECPICTDFTLDYMNKPRVFML